MTDATRDSITIMITKGRVVATKRITLRPGAVKPEIQEYDRAKHFSIREVPAGNIYEFALLLREIEKRPDVFIVRGKPASGVDRNHTLRRLHPRTNPDGTVTPRTFDPAPRRWIPFDLDALPAPDWLDPLDDPDQTVEFAVGHLPAEFHGVTVRWAFTSGQGVKPGIRLRLFFWADRPLEDWELRVWLGERVPQEGVPPRRWPRRYPIDLSIFSPAQPIYVAWPVFVGMIDPVPVRSGLWRGDRDTVTPPKIGKDRSVSPSVVANSGPRWEGGGYETHRARIGDHEGGDGFFGPIKSSVASYLARHGSSVDPSWLRADLERAIREAPRDAEKHPDAYVEARVRDLDSLIAAFVRIQGEDEVSRQPHRVEATYPPPAPSVAEARSEFARVLDGFATAASAYRTDMESYQTRHAGWNAPHKIAV
jgi:hypothetical protein